MKQAITTLVSLLLIALPLGAQAPGLDETLYTVGTTIDDSENNPWAYLLWHSGSAELLQQKSFAIFAKQGGADSGFLYQLKSIVKIQTNEQTIFALLKRAEAVGEDLIALESRINDLFGAYVPADGLSVQAKLSFLIQGSQGEPEVFNNLMLLSRLHPGVAMCLGWGYAGKITPNQETTFEIRQCPLNTLNPDKEWEKVVGRVTVKADEPVVLPAPGAVVGVPVANPQGHLNVRLRWPIDNDLRRLALLHFGYDVYRVSEAFAKNNGFDDTPPTTGQLPQLTLSAPNDVHKLNRVPVLSQQNLSELEANDLNDTDTYFLYDDNDRFSEGGQPFQDGSVFYYFAIARDVLGRGGVPSAPGNPVTICDRMPPKPPRGVKVTNDYVYVNGASKQTLRVTWNQNMNTEEDTTTNYYVYRWADVNEMHENQADPSAFQIAGPIAHVQDGAPLTILDNVPNTDPPVLPDDEGVTFWYSVRAEDSGSCGGNLSGDSTPVFGVLRDREGPEKPGGGLQVYCGRPEVEFVDDSTEAPPPGSDRDPECLHLRLYATAQNESLDWIEYFAGQPGSANTELLGRRYFAVRGLEATLEIATCDYDLHVPVIETEPPASFNPQIWARVGTKTGQVSDAVLANNVGFFSDAKTYVLNFHATFNPTYSAVQQDCPHISVDPVPDPPKVNEIKFDLELKPGTKEWKLYRRVNDGNLTLIKQGLDDFDDNPNIETLDHAMPQNAGRLCYYVQAYDEHGNASPMENLGCTDVTAKELPAAPLLTPVEETGTLQMPTAKITWFAPPGGIDRFRVYVGVQSGNPHQVPFGLNLNSKTPLKGILDGWCFTPHDTQRVGLSGFEGPQFSIEIPVAKNKPYTIYVEAVTPANQTSKRSNFEEFVYTAIPKEGPDVPWPSLGLPEIADPFDDRIETISLGNQGFAVRIGEFPKPTSQPPNPPYRFLIEDATDPLDFVYKDLASAEAANDADGEPESLFPCALYRYQLPNELYPSVSGDVYQVSPLMEGIAHKTVNGDLEIYDPFVADSVAAPNEGEIHVMYLLDTQPLVKGALYRHLLVRFTDLGEIRQVIPLNDLEFLIPE